MEMATSGKRSYQTTGSRLLYQMTWYKENGQHVFYTRSYHARNDTNRVWEIRNILEMPGSKRRSIVEMYLLECAEFTRLEWERGICRICDDYIYGKNKDQWVHFRREGTPFSVDSAWD